MKNIYRLRRTYMILLFLLVSSWNTFAQFKVIGYVPSWAGSVNQIQFSKLTHVNYAFLLPTSTGGLQAIENPAKLQSLVVAAHANGVKVMISVGGWNNGDDSSFESFASNANYRNTFVNNMINFVNQYGLDGVDIDWEYPDNGASANNYVMLMQQLSTEMHNRGKLLTAAIVGINGSSILNSVFGIVDFLNLMAYDYNDFQHSTYDYAVQSINYWRGRGLPAAKTVLGVPFYGRPTWESYAQLLARGANPYSDVFGNVGYNGITTIKSKTNLAFDQGGGVMIWELSQDVTGANSLLTAINQVVIDRSGGGNPNPTPAPIGKTIWLRGSNNLYVSSENGAASMNCNRTSAQGWEQFLVVDAGAGKVALQSMGKYVSSENGTQAINCNRTSIQEWEKFEWITNIDGKISLRGNNGLYISSENGTAPMNCNRASIGGWETFNYGIISVSSARIKSFEVNQTLDLKNISFYPNPLSDKLNYSLPEGLKEASIVIKDSYGNKILNIFQNEVGSKSPIDFSSLKSGLYFLNVSTPEFNKTFKVVKQ